MKSIQTTFIHSSYQGSYPCKCEVIQLWKNKARIRFVDPVSEETRTEIYEKKELAKWEKPTELEKAKKTINKLRKQLQQISER